MAHHGMSYLLIHLDRQVLPVLVAGVVAVLPDPRVLRGLRAQPGHRVFPELLVLPEFRVSLDPLASPGHKESLDL